MHWRYCADESSLAVHLQCLLGDFFIEVLTDMEAVVKQKSWEFHLDQLSKDNAECRDPYFNKTLHNNCMSSQNSGARPVGQEEFKKLEVNNAICPYFHRLCIKAGDIYLQKIIITSCKIISLAFLCFHTPCRQCK